MDKEDKHPKIPKPLFMVMLVIWSIGIIVGTSYATKNNEKINNVVVLEADIG